jgi:hypothetical protein
MNLRFEVEDERREGTMYEQKEEDEEETDIKIEMRQILTCESSRKVGYVKYVTTKPLGTGIEYLRISPQARHDFSRGWEFRSRFTDSLF